MSQPGKSTLNQIIEGIGDRIAARGGESLSFGPIHQEAGVTVIPVTEVRYIFGVGFGQGPRIGDSEAPNHGGGGGGGSWSRPIGYIRIVDGQADYVPVTDLNRLVLLAAVVVGGLGWAILRARSRSRRRWGG